jgi:pSer/pThr/pTyr-binding forkhead associated (FHA) protein
MPLLTIREPGCERVVEIESEKITIGSARDSTLLLNDLKASPLHCVLEKTRHGWWFLTDHNSEGGTAINGERRQKGLVIPGDVISLGGTRIYFERVVLDDEARAGYAPLETPWWMQKALPALISAAAHLIILWVTAFAIFSANLTDKKPPPVITIHSAPPAKEFELTFECPPVKPPEVAGMTLEPIITLEEEVDTSVVTPRGTSFDSLANKNLEFTGCVDAFGLGGGRAGAFGQRGRFFGKPIETGEVIFVIDRTGSMARPTKRSSFDESGLPVNNPMKIDVARNELIRSIRNLSANTKFAVICYSTFGISVWPREKVLVAAGALNKLSAVSWVQSNLGLANARGGTNTADAVSAALKMATLPASEGAKSPTGIYVLTDGAPTTVNGRHFVHIAGMHANGQVKETWDRGEECIKLTKSAILGANIFNARIFTLGIGMDMAVPHPIKNGKDIGDAANEQCRQFLRDIAKSAGGRYREVSE